MDILGDGGKGEISYCVVQKKKKIVNLESENLYWNLNSITY